MDRHREPASEDDWFAEPGGAPAVPAAPVDEAHVASRREIPPTPSRSRMPALVGAVAVAAALAGAGLAWVLGGSGGEASTVTLTTTETTTVVETTTSPTPTTTPEQTTPTTAEPVPPTVREGDSGEAVRAVQQSLADLGYDVTVDGTFGEQTTVAVVAFQTASGLEPDGVVGPATYAALAAAAPSG